MVRESAFIIKLLILTLLLLPSVAFGQNVTYNDMVISTSGVVPYPTIAVCRPGANTTTTPCSPLATIYVNSTSTAPATNPFQGDAHGNFSFWGAAGGHYVVQIYANGMVSRSMDVFLPSSNPAVKPSASDGIFYVSPAGNDSNDGLSWGSAKLTVGGACVAISGGNVSCTAGTGEIYVSPAYTGSFPSAPASTITIVQSGVFLTPLDAPGNLSGGDVALKVPPSSGVQFVSEDGSDSNDGLSWGSAKATVGAACAALPASSSSCSAGAGTIWVSPAFAGTHPTVGSGIFVYYLNAAVGGDLANASGILAVAHGGTGASSLSAAGVATFTGGTTVGDCPQFSSTGGQLTDSGAPCGGSAGVSEATWSTPWPGVLTTEHVYGGETILPSAHTLVRFTVSDYVQAAGCSISPVIQFRDVTTSTSLAQVTLGNGVALADSGPISVSMTGGDTFGVYILTAAVGCSTSPSNITYTAVYQ